MMYATYIMRRTQIYLDPAQTEELVKRARRSGATMSHLIREAIGTYLTTPEQQDEQLARFRSALEASFGVAPTLPPGAEYVKRLRAVDREREAALVRRTRE